MTIGKTIYSIGKEGWAKPTPTKLKLWADIGLLVGLVADTVDLTGMPEFVGKEWIVWSIPKLLITFKLITTFVYEHSQVATDQQV